MDVCTEMLVFQDFEGLTENHRAGITETSSKIINFGLEIMLFLRALHTS